MPGSIYYRGDDRAPNEIFKDGFEKLWPRCPIHLRVESFPGRAPDLSPPTAVCLTRRFEIAPLFPFGNENPRYIYAIYLDDSVIFDTRNFQIQQTKTEIQTVMSRGVSRGDVNELHIGWPLFGYECATDRVPNNQIIGAVRCTILKRSTDRKRVIYRCDSPVRNLLCALPPQIVYQGLKILVQGANAGMQISPDPSTGFGGLTI